MIAKWNKRTPASFYASRQDSGLIRAEGAASVYVVPSAVLRSFAGGSSIFYTAVAYQTQAGEGAAFAEPPGTLARQAPAVSVSPDFCGRTLSAILSVPVEKLVRLRDDGAQPAATATAVAAEPEPDADRAEGEDGYGLAASLDWASDEPAPDELAARGPAAAQGATFDNGESPSHSSADDYEDGFEGPIHASSAYADWDDGGGTQDAPGHGAYAQQSDAGISTPASAQESVFPAGVQAPALLEDEDEPGLNAADAVEPAQTTAYGDEGLGLAEPHSPLDDTPEFEALDAPPTGAPAQAQPLIIPDKKRIIARIAELESGADLYASINADGEYQGRFGPQHPAYQRHHIGLSYGIVRFTQDSGLLGRLLTMMHERDAQKFFEIFGPQSSELLSVTTAPGPPSVSSPQGRSARVQPIAGADLWEEPWRLRFVQAAAHVPFQAAQNELAALTYLDPMVQFAGWLGLNTDRALTMVVDRAVQMGVSGARQWIIEAVGPVQTAAQRQQCLAALGFADIRAFQAATTGLDADGQWTPLTHAAMVAALRKLGGRSPVPIPLCEQMLDAMVRRASSAPWANRVAQLRNASDFTAALYTI